MCGITEEEEHSQLETCFLRIYVAEEASPSDRQVLGGKYTTTTKNPIEFENTI